MRIVDLRRKVPGYNRIPDAKRAALEGGQVLLVSARALSQGGGLMGVLLDKDLLRLTKTVRELAEPHPRLKVMPGGLYGVNLGPEAVQTAMRRR